MPEFKDGPPWSSTSEPLFMDECRKNPVLSTKMAVFVDREAWLSTIRTVYVDDSRLKAGMICLKEVDSANVTNIFCCSGEYSPI